MKDAYDYNHHHHGNHQDSKTWRSSDLARFQITLNQNMANGKKYILDML